MQFVGSVCYVLQRSLCKLPSADRRTVMIIFHCKCGQRITVPEIHAGKKGRCPNCKQVIGIPQASQVAPPGTPHRNVSPKTDKEINKQDTAIGETLEPQKPASEKVSAPDGLLGEMLEHEHSAPKEYVLAEDSQPAKSYSFVEEENGGGKKNNPSPRRFSSKPKLLSGAPNYGGVKFIGVVYELGGVLSCIIGVVIIIFGFSVPTGYSNDSGGVLGRGVEGALILGGIFIFAGLFQIGIGQIFYCIRDMAQNSFHLRRL